MATWIALFRGINVGGKNLLKMQALKQGLESIGLKHVRSYIQSGNLVFESPAKIASKLAARIRAHVDQAHSFRPQVLVLSATDLMDAIEANPYPDATSEPKSLHFYFLDQRPENPGIKALEALRSPNEQFRLIQQVFYLHAPEGIARSRLASKAEHHLGTVATARNYRTVDKLRSMLADS